MEFHLATDIETVVIFTSSRTDAPRAPDLGTSLSTSISHIYLVLTNAYLNSLRCVLKTIVFLNIGVYSIPMDLILDGCSPYYRPL